MAVIKDGVVLVTSCFKLCIALTILVISSLLMSNISTKAGIDHYHRWEICMRTGTEGQYVNADANGHTGCITTNTNKTVIHKQLCPFATKEDQTFLSTWVNNTDIVDSPDGKSKHYEGRWFQSSSVYQTYSTELDKQIELEWNTDICDWVVKGHSVEVKKEGAEFTGTDIHKSKFGQLLHNTLISSIVLSSLVVPVATIGACGRPTITRNGVRYVHSSSENFWVMPWIIMFIFSAVNVGIFANVFAHLHPHDIDVANSIYYTPYRLDILSAIVFSLEAAFMVWIIITIICSGSQNYYDY